MRLASPGLSARRLTWLRILDRLVTLKGEGRRKEGRADSRRRAGEARDERD
jgi:hypothetical protein